MGTSVHGQTLVTTVQIDGCRSGSADCGCQVAGEASPLPMCFLTMLEPQCRKRGEVTHAARPRLVFWGSEADREVDSDPAPNFDPRALLASGTEKLRPGQRQAAGRQDTALRPSQEPRAMAPSRGSYSG